MSIPVPLGVRVFNNFGKAFDVRVTRWVDDITFRSVVPGGFASANITLHNDPAQPFAQLAQLFNRVQIVDLRSSEIAWEGRVDTVRRDTGGDTWELGCLGAMVVASDIQRPMFYIDGDVGSWIIAANLSDIFPNSVDDAKKSMEFRFSAQNAWLANSYYNVATWQRGEETDLRIGRFDITFNGGGSNATARGRFATIVEVTDGGGAPAQDRVDVTTLSTAKTRKGNAIGAASSFTSLLAQRIKIWCANDSTTATVTANSDEAIAFVIEPRVQVQLVDETGAKLTTAASYPNDYLTVSQIVRDVVGRFLVGAWHLGGNNTPYAGQVRPGDIYIDTSSTAQITDLAYWDGTTAAEVLNDLMGAQPGAYWALWESRYGATDGAAGQSETGFRFEWATWPASWGYQATSIDGLEEQPDGSGLYDFLFYQYPTDSPWESQAGFRFMQTYWDTDNQNQLLTDARLVRAMTVKAEEPSSSTTALNKAGAKFAELKRTINTGTLTVRRPIHLYDAGANSGSGASRMLDPWMIRPGKLIRVTDIPPRARADAFGFGTTASPPEHDGTVFRVVSTEYSSADNSCRLELDQVPAWQLATQVARTPIPGGKVVVRG